MSTASPPTSRGRPDASMSLLRQVGEHPLDPGYAAAAAARTATARTAGAGAGGAGVAVGPGRWAPARAGVVTALLAVVMGVVLAGAVTTLRAPDARGDTASLVATLQRRTATADRQARTAASLRAQVQASEDAALAGQGGAPTPGPGLLVASGTTAVTGPGIVITLDDAPGARATASADPRDVDPDDDRLVKDFDLQVVTDGLWSAGAEAIAVNGQRLTASSAIRSAGGAVLVDFRPLSPPYRIRAVGAPNALQTRFALTRAARYLNAIHTDPGIVVHVASSGHLVLPAREGQQLFSAHAMAPAPTPAPTAPTAAPSASASGSGAADSTAGPSAAPPAALTGPSATASSTAGEVSP